MISLPIVTALLGVAFFTSTGLQAYFESSWLALGWLMFIIAGIEAMADVFLGK